MVVSNFSYCCILSVLLLLEWPENSVRFQYCIPKSTFIQHALSLSHPWCVHHLLLVTFIFINTDTVFTCVSFPSIFYNFHALEGSRVFDKYFSLSYVSSLLTTVSIPCNFIALLYQLSETYSTIWSTPFSHHPCSVNNGGTLAYSALQ